MFAPQYMCESNLIYFCLQTFGDILGLAPFPLWRLEAAVAPGPTRLPAAQSAVEEAVANQEADPTVRTRRQRDAEEVPLELEEQALPLLSDAVIELAFLKVFRSPCIKPVALHNTALPQGMRAPQSRHHLCFDGIGGHSESIRHQGEAQSGGFRHAQHP